MQGEEQLKIKELKSIVNKFIDTVLNGDSDKGKSYDICEQLHQYLEVIGVTADLMGVKIEWQGSTIEHYYLKEVGTNLLIDPTADKFSTPQNPIPKVYVGIIPTWRVAWIDESR